MLIGLPDFAKGRKLSKIVINRRLPNICGTFIRYSTVSERLLWYIFNIPYLFLSKGDILHFFTSLINSKLMSLFQVIIQFSCVLLQHKYDEL